MLINSVRSMTTQITNEINKLWNKRSVTFLTKKLLENRHTELCLVVTAVFATWFLVTYQKDKVKTLDRSLKKLQDENSNLENKIKINKEFILEATPLINKKEKLEEEKGKLEKVQKAIVEKQKTSETEKKLKAECEKNLEDDRLLNNKIQEIDNKSNNCKKEITSLNKEIADVKEERKSAQKEITNIESELNLTRAKIDVLTERLKKITEQNEKAISQLNKINNDIAQEEETEKSTVKAFENETIAIQQAIDELKKQISNLESEHKEKINQKTGDKEVLTLKNKIIDIKESIDKTERENNILETDLVKAAEDKEKLDINTKQINDKYEQLDETYGSLLNEILNLRAQVKAKAKK